MAMTVADTDVLIDFLQGVDPGAGHIAREIERGALHTTVVSRFELLAGAKGRRQQRVVDQLLAALITLPLESDAADRAADVRRTLEKEGAPIGMADSLIAGIVLVRRGSLITRNRKHFSRIRDLTLVPIAS